MENIRTTNTTALHENRISRATTVKRVWLIPKTDDKPTDTRYKAAKIDGIDALKNPSFFDCMNICISLCHRFNLFACYILWEVYNGFIFLISFLMFMRHFLVKEGVSKIHIHN